MAQDATPTPTAWQGLCPCPLCGSGTIQVDGRVQCVADMNHSISYEKEFLPWKVGQKDLTWLRCRMKIHMGKIVHHR